MFNRLLVQIYCLLFFFLPLAQALDWQPVDPAQLTLDKPKIDPNADAEAILWEVWVADQSQGDMLQTVLTHYVRVKVFTDRGAEDQSTIDLISGSNSRIHDLQGRTIKPDGRIVDLEKASVFERTVAKTSGVKVTTKSFSMPNVEAGDVIEYQWREYRDNVLSNYMRLQFQRDIPTWLVKYHVKPLPQAVDYGYRMQTQRFNFEHSGFKPEPQGYYVTTLEHVPAFVEEPQMPPEDHVRSWLLLFYSKQSEVNPEKYWKDIGKELYKSYKTDMKVDGPIKETAARVAGDGQTTQEKVDLMLAWCLNNIKNIYHDRDGVTAEARSKLKDNKKPSDTLKAGMGNGAEINQLFATLLNAVEIDARIAHISGRDDSFFNPGFMDPYFLNRRSVAVNIDGAWKFFDLAAPYLPSGMLTWPEEGVAALIPDPKDPAWVTTPLSGPEVSVATRTGDFKLSEDGALEGLVKVIYSGHDSLSRKNRYDAEAPEKREEILRESLKASFGDAEFTEISIDNATDLTEPFSYSYRIKLPGYAIKTGKRLFLQPSYFERHSKPLFQTSERKHEVYFAYPWSEKDVVVIELPAGFQLENPEAPVSYGIQNVGGYKADLGLSDGNKLVYRREFIFGQNGNIIFPVSAYAQLKDVFNAFHQQDTHTVTLLQSDPAPAE